MRKSDGSFGKIKWALPTFSSLLFGGAAAASSMTGGGLFSALPGEPTGEEETAGLEGGKAPRTVDCRNFWLSKREKLMIKSETIIQTMSRMKVPPD